MATACHSNCYIFCVVGIDDARWTISNFWIVRANVHNGGGEFFKIFDGLLLFAHCIWTKFCGAVFK
jgi:hypothetical protein